MTRRKLARAQMIDDVLSDWEYVPGEVNARLLKVADGRQVLQLRIDMGVLQMETENRPDGTHPGGADTYYDYLVGLAIREGDDFLLSEEQCDEVEREFMQFYQRRVCWLALHEYDRAVRDADHNLGLMDFVEDCSPSEEWTASHEQYRPFVLFHRTYASAMAQMEDDLAEKAIDEINRGLDRMREFFSKHDADERFDDDELVDQLLELRESLRDRYEIGQTLNEQLSRAIADEQYELAAKIRDKIARRAH